MRTTSSACAVGATARTPRTERTIFSFICSPLLENRLIGSCVLFGNELPEPFAFGVAKNLVGRAFFFNHALTQKHDAAGNIAGEAHLMGHDQHGAPLCR